jgi:succinoglycan biosynthesis transport protein ExoP
MAERAGGARPQRLGVLRSIWRRKEIVAIFTLTVAAGALVVSLLEDPVYEATASVLLSPSDDSQLTASQAIEFADADEIAQRAGDRLGGVDPASILQRTRVEQGDAPDLFTVSADAEGPISATELADVYARKFVTYVDDLPDFDGEADVVEKAIQPDTPKSPQTVRNTLLGALVGLLLGIIAVLVWGRLDPRVRAARELDGILGVPLLGRIPKSPALALDPRLRHLPAAEAEDFQMARVSIRYLDVEPEVRSVVLTSAGEGDGKTTVAFGIAVAAATSGDRVMVIEADMRRPGLAAVVEPTPVGLSNLLEGKAELDEALMTVEVAVGPEAVAGLIDVVQAGPTPANPTQLIESQAMVDLLQEAERNYDLVLIDTPPAALLPDAIPLMGHVDGVVVVAGLGRDRRDDLHDLRGRLAHVNAPLIGAIANFAPGRDESYFEDLRAQEAAAVGEGAAPLRAVGGAATPATGAPAARRSRSRREPRQPRATPVEPPPSVPLPDGPVDVNQVTYEELRALELSTTQAKRLLAYRERRGGFDSIDEIDDVPGFPDQLREELKRRINV